MTLPLLCLIVANFAGIGLLSLFFFRRDFSVNGRWLATALPHAACPVLLVVVHLAGGAPLTPRSWDTALASVAVVASATSVALMFFAWGTHRVRLAHFHQSDDAPVQLVTEGAYQRIRHPFYTSYLLLYLAVLLAFPHWWTLLLLGYTLVVFTLTARAEEARLAGSVFGDEYRAYLTRTGRFLPPLGDRGVRAGVSR